MGTKRDKSLSKRVFACLLSVLILSAANACGSGAATSTDSSTSTIRMRVQTDLDTWDNTKAASTGSLYWMGPVYETLIRATPEGKFEPLLAESYAFSADGRVLTLETRAGVTFSDGTAFDAKAVVSNLDRAMTVDGSQRAPKLKEAIASLAAPDETTVAITLTDSGVAILDLLSQMEGIMASPKAFAEPDFANKPVGTGPFVLTEHKKGQSMTFKANPNYWGDGPKVGGLELQIIPDDQTTVSALSSGEIDLFTESQSMFADTLIQQAKGTPNVTVAEPGGVNLTEITLNRAPGQPFADPRVRQAIYYAIDFDGLSAIAPRMKKSLQYAVSGSPFFDSGLEDLYSYDPGKAKQLLAEAGYPNGFSFTMRAVESGPLVPMASYVQSNLSEVGIDVKVQVTPLPAFRQDCYVDKKCNSTFTRVSMSADPARVAQSRMIPTGSGAWGPIPDDVNAAYKTASALADEATHVANVRAFSRAYAESAQNLVLAQAPIAVIARKSLSDIQVDFGGMIIWEKIAKS